MANAQSCVSTSAQGWVIVGLQNSASTFSANNWRIMENGVWKTPIPSVIGKKTWAQWRVTITGTTITKCFFSLMPFFTPAATFTDKQLMFAGPACSAYKAVSSWPGHCQLSDWVEQCRQRDMKDQGDAKYYKQKADDYKRELDFEHKRDPLTRMSLNPDDNREARNTSRRAARLVIEDESDDESVSVRSEPALERKERKASSLK
jgi:hypothetical protein